MTSPQPTATADWFGHLKALLTRAAGNGVGAQLTVTDPDNTVIYRQPLARHARIEDDVLWMRQIVGDGPEFDMHSCRRRSLPTPDARRVDDHIEFPIDEGTATIAAADPDQHQALNAWDTYLATTFTDQQQDELAEVAEDSWWG